MFPQISGPVDYYVKNPQFQTSVVNPAVGLANKVLPDKLQIPAQNIMGVSTEYSETSPIKSITEELSKQAASVAASLLKESTKAVSDQFCSTLLEKIKAECGK